MRVEREKWIGFLDGLDDTDTDQFERPHAGGAY
jgi:hypothetical protein